MLARPAFATLPIASQVQQLLLHIGSSGPPADGRNALASLPFWASLTRAHKQRLLFAIDQRCKASSKRARAVAAADETPRSSSADMVHAVRTVMRAFGDAPQPRIAAAMRLHDVVRAWIRGVVAVAAWRATLCPQRASSAPALAELPAAVALRLAPPSATVLQLCELPIAAAVTKLVRIKASDLAAMFPVHGSRYSKWASEHDDSNASAHSDARDSGGGAADDATLAHAYAGAQGSAKGLEATALSVGAVEGLTASTRARVGAMLAQRQDFLDRYTSRLDGETYELEWYPQRAAWRECMRGESGSALLAQFAGVWRKNKCAAEATLHRVRVRVAALRAGAPAARREASAAASPPAKRRRIAAEEANVLLQVCAAADTVNASCTDMGVDAVGRPMWRALELTVKRVAMDSNATKLLGYITHSRVAQLVEKALELRANCDGGGAASADSAAPLEVLDVERAARALDADASLPLLLWRVPPAAALALAVPTAAGAVATKPAANITAAAAKAYGARENAVVPGKE